MHCQNNHQRSGHHTAMPIQAKPAVASTAHWATTHFYFDIADLDALMKRLCLALIIVLIAAGTPALAG